MRIDLVPHAFHVHIFNFMPYVDLEKSRAKNATLLISHQPI